MQKMLYNYNTELTPFLKVYFNSAQLKNLYYKLKKVPFFINGKKTFLRMINIRKYGEDILVY